eukprot:TRINITY_DN50388_c0_g1_i1.p1 TRINITY_DN50388_c0_g1~~TRINITY_DN50388_c0_g1_i1.p1  ORF type:complete len:646 (-),score=103.19 TRINITY_DN50388_c0_g1_i1:91-2028(-)
MQRHIRGPSLGSANSARPNSSRGVVPGSPAAWASAAGVSRNQRPTPPPVQHGHHAMAANAATSAASTTSPSSPRGPNLEPWVCAWAETICRALGEASLPSSNLMTAAGPLSARSTREAPHSGVLGSLVGSGTVPGHVSDSLRASLQMGSSSGARNVAATSRWRSSVGALGSRPVGQPYERVPSGPAKERVTAAPPPQDKLEVMAALCRVERALQPFLEAKSPGPGFGEQRRSAPNSPRQHHVAASGNGSTPGVTPVATPRFRNQSGESMPPGHGASVATAGMASQRLHLTSAGMYCAASHGSQPAGTPATASTAASTGRLGATSGRSSRPLVPPLSLGSLRRDGPANASGSANSTGIVSPAKQGNHQPHPASEGQFAGNASGRSSMPRQSPQGSKPTPKPQHTQTGSGNQHPVPSPLVHHSTPSLQPPNIPQLPSTILKSARGHADQGGSERGSFSSRAGQCETPVRRSLEADGSVDNGSPFRLSDANSSRRKGGDAAEAGNRGRQPLTSPSSMQPGQAAAGARRIPPLPLSSLRSLNEADGAAAPSCSPTAVPAWMTAVSAAVGACADAALNAPPPTAGGLALLQWRVERCASLAIKVQHCAQRQQYLASAKIEDLETAGFLDSEEEDSSDDVSSYTTGEAIGN